MGIASAALEPDCAWALGKKPMSSAPMTSTTAHGASRRTTDDDLVRSNETERISMPSSHRVLENESRHRGVTDPVNRNPDVRDTFVTRMTRL